MLTHKQRDLLALILEHTSDTGVPPSFDEMKDQLGLKSKSGIHRLITGLEERGYIRRLKNKARALEVLRTPDGRLIQTTTPEPDPETKLAEEIIGDAALIRNLSSHGTISDQNPNQGFDFREADASSLEKVRSLPLFGRIAAGLPIEAISESGRRVDVPTNLLGKGQHYALEVYGDSMIEAGIHDGDIAIIRKTHQVNNGEVAVCLVEREEATLKYFRRDHNIVTLTPANRQHRTQVYPAGSVQIQGRLCSLMRSY